MFWNTSKVQPLYQVAHEALRGDWQERDQEAAFSHSAWKRVFGHSSFPKLDFSSPEKHRQTTLEMMAALYAVAHGGMDLPFVASLAAQSAIGPEILGRFAASEVKSEVLPAIQSGDELVAICNSEQGSGTNLRAMKSLCQLHADGTGTLKAWKPLATNAFGAKNILVSAWAQEAGGGTPSMELFLVGASHAQTLSVAEQMSGFRTGNCGSVEIKEANIRIEKSRLGAAGSGIAVFKHCFDSERLYLAVLVAGVLHAVEDIALEHLAARPALHDKQYVQEKLLEVSAARTKILALVNLVISNGLEQMNKSQVELSLLKWMCAEDAASAVQAAADLNGWTSMTGHNILNKTARDFQGLRYFGGTIELQKMNLFGWLTRHLAAKHAKAA